MLTGFVLMLSDHEPPDPIKEEVPALLEYQEQHGHTYGP